MEDDLAKDHLKDHEADKLGECESEVMMSAQIADANVQVYPNPFTSSTAIGVTFPEAQQYTVEVYDGKGQLVERWTGTTAKAGEKVKLDWTPKRGDRGLYLVKIITKDGVQNRQILRQ